MTASNLDFKTVPSAFNQSFRLRAEALFVVVFFNPGLKAGAKEINSYNLICKRCESWETQAHNSVGIFPLT